MLPLHLTCFRVALRSIGLEIVLDLLRHPLPPLQTFGAQILLNHQTQPIDFPPGLIDALIESPVESVRVIGVQLFGQLPDRILLNRIELILTLATHELTEMRSAIRSSINRLAAAHPSFTTALVAELLPILLAPEQHEGLHNFLSQLLQTDLPNWMEVTSPETTWTLLNSTATASQYLADYAAGNLARLAELMPYFVRVLAQVNRARVAKQRILSFLTSEAINSESAAKLIVEVLTRQSVSSAIIDKTHALEALLKIHQLYPHLSVPIIVKPLPVKT
jgi:hypothetical protein